MGKENSEWMESLKSTLGSHRRFSLLQERKDGKGILEKSKASRGSMLQNIVVLV